MAKSINRRLAELVTSTGDVASSALDNIDTLDSADIISISSNTAGATAVFDTLDSLPTSGLSAGQQAYVQSNNRLYVSNGTGWYNLALINQSPNLTIDPTGTIVLATDGSPTTITLTATDSDTPIAGISFSVESDGNFAGLGSLSQDSSVFTITPLTESDASTTSATLTFKASDGISFGTGTSALSLQFAAPVVSNSRYTIAHINATGVGRNSTPTDASPSNESISTIGSPEMSTFSPYRSSGYSFYQNGTGYITWPAGSHLDFGTGDFTVEWWQFWEKNPSGGDTLMSIGYVTPPNFLLETATSARRYNLYLNSTGTIITEGTEANAGEWSHYAVVRNGGGTNNVKIYRNGQVSAQGTYTGAVGNSSNELQLLSGTGGPNSFVATFITDLRMVKGTAVYTSTFTPNTEPLTAISGTTLLVGNSAHADDMSSNRLRGTVAGSYSIETAPFSPYDKTNYSQSDHGGSVFLEAGSSSALRANLSNIGTSNFTVEGWVYYDNMNNNHTFFSGDATNYNFDVYWQSASTNYKLYMGSASPTTHSIGGTYSPAMKQWIHLAVTRNGNTATMWANGIQIGQVTNAGIGSANIDGNDFMVGSYTTGGAELTEGYISDFRVQQGLKYTAGSNFDPPTSAVGAAGSNLYLCHGADCNIIDKSQAQYGIDLDGTNNLTGSTAVTKFSSASIYFSGTSGDAITLEQNNDLLNLEPEGGYWTIEYWFYQISSLGTVVHWETSDTGLAGANMTSFYHGSNGNLYYYAGGVSVFNTGSGVISPDTWHHIAIVRSNSNGYIFVDGQEEGSTTSMADPNNFYHWRIGDRVPSAPSANYPVYGYMEDFRITKGLARYTSNFTPPSAELEG